MIAEMLAMKYAGKQNWRASVVWAFWLWSLSTIAALMIKPLVINIVIWVALAIWLKHRLLKNQKVDVVKVIIVALAIKLVITVLLVTLIGLTAIALLGIAV